MKFCNLLLLLLTQTFCWLGLCAQSIDAEDAATRARDFFLHQQTTAQGGHKAQAVVQPVLAYTAKTADTPDFYVFNRAADLPGFVIVNADATSTTEILGYSEMSTFDYDTAPDNFKWWLEQYQTNGVTKAPAKASGIRHDVDYLCKTKWNQDEPYSNAINQVVTGALGPNYDFVTGCAATSMAQVMKYYNYPDHGVGNRAYSIEYNNGEFKLNFSADFAHTTYDWANMLDDYSHGYNDTQADAVATLMYHCGVAQDMSYNNSLGGGSSAGVGANGKAMIDHFRYDKSMRYADRFYYTDDAWEDLLYNELVNQRPILYSGYTAKNEGHSFICDGYRAVDGTFHFNWGWGGSSDGYYVLTGDDPLNPYASGIGGGTIGLGFTVGQVALVGIKKDEGGDIIKTLGTRDELLLWQQEGNFLNNYDLDLTKGKQTFNYRYGPHNPSLYEMESLIAGIELRHQVTGQCIYCEGNSYNYTFYIGTFWEMTNLYNQRQWTMSFSTEDLPLFNGVYELRPAFKIDGEWYTGQYGASLHIPTLTVTGGENPVDVNVPLTISATQVMVGKSVSISHGNHYSGKITYESDNPEVASVSKDGVVTGVTLGQTTITARAEAVTGFLETVKTFSVTVVSHIYRDVDVILGKKNLKVGEAANISITASYDGETSYSVAPEGVVSVSDEGLVTALAEGDAIITVNIAGNGDFRPSTHKLEVTVSQLPPLPAEPGLCMDNYPWVAKDNIATSSDLTLHIPLYNSSSSVINPVKFYVRMYCDRGYVKWSCGYNNYDYPAGGHDDYILDPIVKGYSQYFTPGKVYTYEFYLDEDCTKPMNVPSLTYYYSPDNPTMASTAQLINGTQNGNAATRRLVKSLVSKILQKQ